MSEVTLTTYEGPEIEAESVGTTITVVVGALSAGGGGGGAVDSVNSQIGVVVLDAIDVGADPTGTAASAVAGEAIARAAADALLAPKASPTFTGTVSGITKTMVGLGNVDNTSDASKPVSTAQATADTAIGTAAATDATTKANAAQAAAIQRANHTGTQSADTLTDGTTNKAFLATERTKLAGIATGATANDTDANLLARANHTGTQAISTVTGLQTALDGKETSGAAAAAQAAAIAASQPVDSDLTAIAALSTTTFGRSLLTQADAAALRTTAGLGTAATQASTAFDASGAAAAAQAASQPLDSDLTAIAALSTTSFGRSFLALADAAAGRTLLGLGTAATVNTGTSSGDLPLLSTGGRLPIARIASGTPDGTKFVRDDGTLVTPSGGGGGAVATDAIFDAKGDLPVGTGADTAAKLTVGSNGQALVADSTQTTGVKWAGDASWTAPTLGASWTNFGTYDNAGYRKDAQGRVWLRGLIQNGTSGATIFTLPSGYRPTGKKSLFTWGIVSGGIVEVTTAGAVSITWNTSGYYSLDVVCFWTD